MNIRSKNGAIRIKEINNPSDALPVLSYLKKFGKILKGQMVNVHEVRIMRDEDGVQYNGPRKFQIDDIKVDELATNFTSPDGGWDWSEGAIVFASDSDGNKWLVDGRHRLTALRKQNQESVFMYELEFAGAYASYPFHTALRKAGAKANSHNKPSSPNDEPTFAYNLRCDLGLEDGEPATWEGPVTKERLRMHLRSEYDSDLLLSASRETRIVNQTYAEWEYANAPADSRIQRYNRTQAGAMGKAVEAKFGLENVRTQSVYGKNQADEVATHLLTDGDGAITWTKEFSDALVVDETTEVGFTDTYDAWSLIFRGVLDIIKSRNEGNNALSKIDLSVPSMEWFLENNNYYTISQTATTIDGSEPCGEGRVKRIKINDLPSVKRANKAA